MVHWATCSHFNTFVMGPVDYQWVALWVVDLSPTGGCFSISALAVILNEFICSRLDH